MAVTLRKKAKKTIVKGGKGYIHPREKYSKTSPNIDLKNQYQVGEKVHDIGKERKPYSKTRGAKAIHKVSGERNVFTPVDPNMPLRGRRKRYSTATTGTRTMVKKDHERWLEKRAKARARLKKR